MSFSSISKLSILAGKPFSNVLASLIRTNFEDHESRLLALESDAELLPVGVILELSVAQAPPNTLECLGQEVSRDVYSDLFNVIGTTYGAGDGSTTFNIPDKRGRVSVGKGSGSGLTTRTIGDVFGSETHTLSEAELASHNHGLSEDTGHSHRVGPRPGSVNENSLQNISTVSTYANKIDAPTFFASTNISIDAAGGNNPHNNVQSSLVVKSYITV